MFDDLLDPATCGEVSRAQMVTALRQYHRLQATVTARKWAFVAMLLRDHEDEATAAEQQHWAHDAWAAARDQIGPAMSLSPRRAAGQMRIAEALALRLPEVASLLEHGMISESVAATIVYRTELVDPSAQPVVDAEIAARAGGFSTLSDTDREMAIDAVVEEHDPDAVRRYREAAKNCDVAVGKRDDPTGTASLYGRVSALDADLSMRILNAYADTVCHDDPRSRGQLRSAAYGAVFRRHDRLVCQCATPTCAAASIPSKVESVIVHVLGEHATLEAALAQVAAAQHLQPPDSTAPTVDIEALVRDCDRQTETAAGQHPGNAPPPPTPATMTMTSRGGRTGQPRPPTTTPTTTTMTTTRTRPGRPRLHPHRPPRPHPTAAATPLGRRPIRNPRPLSQIRPKPARTARTAGAPQNPRPPPKPDWRRRRSPSPARSSPPHCWPN